MNSKTVFEFSISDGKLFHTGIVLIANEFNLIGEGDNDNGPRMVRFCACVICF